MKTQKQMAKGYIVVVKDGDNWTETHYAVKPNGQVLYSDGNRFGGSNFGPENSDDWGQSSSLPEHAEFCGNYLV